MSFFQNILKSNKYHLGLVKVCSRLSKFSSGRCRKLDINSLLSKMSVEKQRPSKNNSASASRVEMGVETNRDGDGKVKGQIKEDIVVSGNASELETYTNAKKVAPSELQQSKDLPKKWERRPPEIPRHIKYRKKGGGQLPQPGIMHLQVIGTGGSGRPKSVLLVTDHFRYLFNCGEGTQRVLTEHKMKPAKIEHIFITHNSWDNIGGLLGMALTLQSVGIPKVTLHGPPHVENLMKYAGHFADTKTTELVKFDASNKFYEDHAMKLEYIPLYRNGTTNEPYGKRRRLSEGTQGDIELHKDMAIAFLCKPHLYPRKVVMEKCVDMGLTKGPQIGELKKGNDVTLPDGRVIKPDDVLSEQLPSPPFLIMDCPSEEYLDSLTSCADIKPYQNDGSDLTRVLDVIVHFTPKTVMELPRYQAWLKSFPVQTKHLVLDDTSGNLLHLGVVRIQAVLNMLSDRVFPLLPCQRNGPVDQRPSKEVLASQVVSGFTNLIYHLRPNKGFDGEQCLEFDNDVFIKEAKDQENVEDKLAEMKEKFASIESQGVPTGLRYPEIVFLGTGSSVPCKVRNVSAILIHLMEDTSILLDCGEGTLGQLYRHYGDETVEVLKKLKCVYVSHMHADHHIGMFSILSERNRLCQSEDKPLLLVPQGYAHWIKNYEQTFDPVGTFLRLYPLQAVKDYDQSNPDYKFILQHLHLKKLETEFVRHIPGSFGIAITHQNGWKITYSGDTTPCDNIVKIGADSDILIHEASMEDDLEEEARLKHHSTTSQAIEIGLRMNARFILLNHFSQRYAKVPIFSDKFSDKVGFSFDNMRVTMDDIPLFPHFIEPLKAIFADHYADMEVKTLKKLVHAKSLELSEKVKASSS